MFALPGEEPTISGKSVPELPPSGQTESPPGVPADGSPSEGTTLNPGPQDPQVPIVPTNESTNVPGGITPPGYVTKKPIAITGITKQPVTKYPSRVTAVPGSKVTPVTKKTPTGLVTRKYTVKHYTVVSRKYKVPVTYAPGVNKPTPAYDYVYDYANETEEVPPSEYIEYEEETTTTDPEWSSGETTDGGDTSTDSPLKPPSKTCAA